LYLNKCLSNYYLLLEKDYKWIQSSQYYMTYNEQRLNSMLKKPSDEIKVFNNVIRNNRDIG
jgi:hypothetical protein